jgi:hypothetical protein
MRSVPTAPVAAGALIAGYAVASASGSRPLGGLVLAAGAVWCLRAWDRRNGRRTAVVLGSVGAGAFVLSHVLAPQIGAWPSVLTVAAATALAASVLGDRRARLAPA